MMKITTVIRKDIIKKEAIVHERLQIICFAVIAAALICGTLIFMFSDDAVKSELKNVFTDYFFLFSAKGKTEIFSGVLISYIPYIISMIVFSSSSVGYILILFLSFLKTAGLGMVSACLYSFYGLKGIEYSLLIFFPGKILLLFSLLCMMCFCVNRSLSVHYIIKGERGTENPKDYFALKIAFTVFMIAVSAAVDCLLVSAFSSLFIF